MISENEDNARTWLDGLEYCRGDYDRIDTDIERARKDFEDFLAQKESERVAVEAKFGFAKGILTSAVGRHGTSQNGLWADASAALEFIGFDVFPVEGELRAAIKRDACWVQDGHYLALLDVTATDEANITLREYHRLLGAIALILRHQDKAPGKVAPVGLLIVNHDRTTHPFDRPKLYEGSDGEVLRDALDHRIGLLSTVELYRLVLAVEEETLSNLDARNIVKRPGRIEFNAKCSEESISAHRRQPTHIVLGGRVLAI